MAGFYFLFRILFDSVCGIFSSSVPWMLNPCYDAWLTLNGAQKISVWHTYPPKHIVNTVFASKFHWSESSRLLTNKPQIVSTISGIRIRDMTPCTTWGPTEGGRLNNFSFVFFCLCLVAGEKAIVCDQCGAQFQKEDALEAHRQIHTGVKQTLIHTNAHIKHTQMS